MFSIRRDKWMKKDTNLLYKWEMASEVKSLALGLWGALVMGRINPKQDKTPHGVQALVVVLGDETETDEAEEEMINQRTAEPGGDGEEEGACIDGMEVCKERGCI